jgi:thioredoxin-dependent peroxiredoxin
MRLQVGQPAPMFTAVDLYGRRGSLAQYAGTHVLLSFYRFAACPLCDLRMWHLIRRYAEYRQRGLNIIAFVESAPDKAHWYLDRLQAPFPIIPDPKATVYAMYGLEKDPLAVPRSLVGRRPSLREASQLKLGSWRLRDLDGAFGRLPADFVIGPDQRIEVAYYGKDSGDFLLFDDIDRFLRSHTHTQPQLQPQPWFASPPRSSLPPW